MAEAGILLPGRPWVGNNKARLIIRGWKTFALFLGIAYKVCWEHSEHSELLIPKSHCLSRT